MPGGQSPRKPRLSTDQRRALRLLASSRDGVSEALMMAHGFGVKLMAGLVQAELAATSVQRIVGGGREVQITRMKITDAGRKAL
jgi:hypothetical protein